MRTWTPTPRADLFLVAALAACSPVPDAVAPDVPPASTAKGARVLFEYQGIDGRPVSTASMAGRFAVIGFATTYDVASQAQAKFLLAVSHRHVPRVNAALLVLERPENRPMIEAFAATLRLDYPVAIADAATIAGDGPFSGLHHVPSVVILDREGREVWRHVGLVDEDTIRAALSDAER